MKEIAFCVCVARNVSTDALCMGPHQRSKFWLSVRPGQPKTLPDNQR